MKSVAGIVFIVLAVVGCGKKQEPEVVVPPGFCKTEAECQPVADRQNAYQEQLREKLVAQGVHDEYLPCGKYEPRKAPNGYWNVAHGTAGCPSTASQQDPHPDPNKAKRPKP